MALQVLKLHFSEMRAAEMDEKEAPAPVLIDSMWFSSRGTMEMWRSRLGVERNILYSADTEPPTLVGESAVKYYCRVL